MKIVELLPLKVYPFTLMSVTLFRCINSKKKKLKGSILIYP